MEADRIVEGDCLDALSSLPGGIVDLVLTSPPYADRRKAAYGGPAPEGYLDWFLPRSAELLRVLKPTGSFILNIKEHCRNGERQTYVLELVLALRRQGWGWVEEYIWAKTTSMPGKWPNRLRDAWEHCFHFAKQRKFAMYQDAVRVPMAESTKARAERAVAAGEFARQEMATGSGFGTNRTHWAGRDTVLPDNVLRLPLECSNRKHPAAFPLALPAFFIKLLTFPGDLVLDPFCGSGTACVAAKSLGRRYLGVEMSPPYCAEAKRRLESGK